MKGSKYIYEIGINTSSRDRTGYGRGGENAYNKLKEHGFLCSYFSMMDTENASKTRESNISFSSELLKIAKEIVRI